MEGVPALIASNGSSRRALPVFEQTRLCCIDAAWPARETIDWSLGCLEALALAILKPAATRMQSVVMGHASTQLVGGSDPDGDVANGVADGVADGVAAGVRVAPGVAAGVAEGEALTEGCSTGRWSGGSGSGVGGDDGGGGGGSDAAVQLCLLQHSSL